MTKPDLAAALVPHLIGSLPDPFSPNPTSARQVMEVASQWAELMHAEATKDKQLHMFVVP